MPSAPVCIMENEAGSEYLFKKCSRKPLLQGDLSHHGVKEKYQPLYQKLVLNMVRIAGFEPASQRRLILSQLCMPFHHIRTTQSV